jgi:cleavage and polyadenylation specificity factor subunit 1
LGGKKKTLQWGEDQQLAFEEAKKAIARVAELTHPDPAAPVSLATDASSSHVGAVLQQWQKDHWRPLAFFSRKLSKAEVNYSTFDRELLAAFLAVKQFRFQLEGRQFKLFTDHKPLVAAIQRVTPPLSARQQRQLSFLAEFQADLCHTPGVENVVADVLSRPPTACNVQQPDVGPVDFERMAELQATCPDLEQLRARGKLKLTCLPAGQHQLWGDCSTGVFRPVVPEQLRPRVFNVLHAVSHPGVRASRRMVASRFVWPGLSSDVSTWARQCMACQTSKITRHVQLQPQHIHVPGRHFAHVHIDIVGPLPDSEGHRHVLTMIDRSTRWLEAVPLKATAAADCARALFEAWVARFGVPTVLTSDRGPQFTSAVWAGLCELLQIKHVKTTAYHPQSNGVLERVHRSLKAALKARAAGTRWSRELPWVLLGLRTAPRDSTGESAAEHVYGTQLVLPGQFLSPPAAEERLREDVRAALDGFRPPPTRHDGEQQQKPAAPPEDLMVADYVLVRRDGPKGPLDRPYDGPFKVIQRSAQFFKVQVGEKLEVITTARLKAVKASEDVQEAQPRPRGRPRKRVSFLCN